MFFENPLTISMIETGAFDAITLSFVEERFFRDPENGAFLAINQREIYRELPG
jgi:hypothetical protein